MMGGGWDRLYLRDFTKPHSFSIAIGILVPWNATNQEHRLAVRIEDQDTVELRTAQLGFNAGRPPMLRDAQSQRVLLALQVETTFPAAGTYIVKGIVDDVAATKTEFHIEQKPVEQNQLNNG